MDKQQLRSHFHLACSSRVRVCFRSSRSVSKCLPCLLTLLLLTSRGTRGLAQAAPRQPMASCYGSKHFVQLADGEPRMASKTSFLHWKNIKKINPFGCFASFSFLFRFEGKQHSKQAADTCERSLCSPKRCHKPRWWHLHPPKGGMEDQRQGDFFPWRQTCADLFSWEGSPSCHPPSHHNLTSGGPQAENARGGLWPEIKKQALETGTELLSCSLIPRARCELSGWGTAEQS